MRTHLRVVLAAALVMALGAAGAPAHAADTPKAPVADVQVTDAQLRWSLQQQLHRKPYYGKNFLMAGALPDTKGGDMPAAQWRQSAGNVSIVRAKGSTYVPATWSTFGTGTDHQAVIEGGTGTVDRAAGTARISWTGRVGVARYSGQTGFTLSDPTLVVAGGTGRLEATLDGYGVSRDGNGSGDASGPLRSTTVVLADLGRVDLTGKGFSIEPAFDGVEAGHPEQKTASNGRRGSFPPSFIAFVDQVGQSPFWMTSGSADDALKSPTPLTVSFSADDTVDVDPPVPVDGTADPITNSTRSAPGLSGQPQPAAPMPPGFAPASTPAAAGAAAEQVAFAPAASSSSLTGAAPVVTDPDGRSTLGWWLAAWFLLMALAVALPPFVRPSRPA